MREVDDGPGHARGAIEDGKDDKPREEDDENVGGPHPRVREPLGVPVQIRRWHRPYVHCSTAFSHRGILKRMTNLLQNQKVYYNRTRSSSCRVDVAERREGDSQGYRTSETGLLLYFSAFLFVLVIITLLGLGKRGYLCARGAFLEFSRSPGIFLLFFQKT